MATRRSSSRTEGERETERHVRYPSDDKKNVSSHYPVSNQQEDEDDERYYHAPGRNERTPAKRSAVRGSAAASRNDASTIAVKNSSGSHSSRGGAESERNSERSINTRRSNNNNMGNDHSGNSERPSVSASTRGFVSRIRERVKHMVSKQGSNRKSGNK
ncbi:MAG TPA: hypothetical protein VF476_04705 [Chitinophagaceae bacterium]